jgi:hypothetical protein
MYILVTIIFRLMDMSQSQLPLRTVNVETMFEEHENMHDEVETETCPSI